MVENWMPVSEDGATSGVETKEWRLLCGVKIDNTSLARTLKGVKVNGFEGRPRVL